MEESLLGVSRGSLLVVDKFLVVFGVGVVVIVVSSVLFAPNDAFLQ